MPDSLDAILQLKAEIQKYLKSGLESDYFDLVDQMFCCEWFLPCRSDFPVKGISNPTVEDRRKNAPILSDDGLGLMPVTMELAAGPAGDLEKIMLLFSSEEKAADMFPKQAVLEFSFLESLELFIAMKDDLSAMFFDPQEGLFELSKDEIEKIYEDMTGGGNVRLELGNIANARTEAIVCPSNNTLRPRGGLDRLIHRTAGPELLDACKKIGGCETGKAQITEAYGLAAKYVIHTVGPFYRGEDGEAELLRSCYLSSLELAKDHGIKSISFPLISTGYNDYPLQEAIKIMLKAIYDWLEENPNYDMNIALVCKDDRTRDEVLACNEDIEKEL